MPASTAAGSGGRRRRRRLGPAPRVADGVSQGAHRSLGTRVRGDLDAVSRESRRRLSTTHEHAEQRRRRRFLRQHRAMHRLGDIVCAGRQRADEDGDDGVHRRVSGDNPDRLLVVLGARRRDHVHRIGDGGVGREPLREPIAGRLGQRLDPQPAGSAGVRADDPRPAGVGDDGDPVAGRERLVGQQRGHVEELAHRVGADDAGVSEHRVDGRVAGGEQRPRVRGRGALARRRAPRLHRHDGLVPGNVPGEAAELARVAERLEVEQDDVGRRDPDPSRRGSRCPRGRPCCPWTRRKRARGRGPRPPRAPRCRRRRSGMRTRCGRASAAGARTSRPAGRRPSVHSTPRQLGPTRRMPAPRQTASSSACRCLAGLIHLGEAGRHDDEGAHALGARSRAPRRDGRRRHGDDGELHRRRAPRARTRCAGRPSMVTAARAHQVQVAAEATGDEVVQRARVRRCRDVARHPPAATEEGRRTWWTAPVAAMRSRASNAARASGVSAVGSVISRAPGRVWTSTGNPDSRNTRIIRWLAGSTVAVKRRDALGRWRRRPRCASRIVAMP